MPINKIKTASKATIVALLFATLAACTVTVQQNDSAASHQLAYLRLTEGTWQVWLTDGSGSRHRQLTTDPVDKTRLSWSPDRKALLYNGNNGRLYRLSLETDEPAILPLPLTGMLDATLSPDGQWLGFSLQSTHEQDNNDLWVMRLNGKGARKLANQPGVSQMLSWAPIGDVVAYTQSENRNDHQLWQLTVANGERRQLTVGDANYFDPSYSPSSQLAYAANLTGNYDIWVYGPHGKLQQITHHPAYDAQPSWSPTGDAIAFYSQRGNQRRIWVKNLKNNQLKPITPGDAASRLPVWR